LIDDPSSVALELRKTAAAHPSDLERPALAAAATDDNSAGTAVDVEKGS
jgi:hypothetical protein